MSIRRKISLIFFILAAVAGSFFYFFNQMTYSHGRGSQTVLLVIAKGDNAFTVGKKLQAEGLISQEIYFVAYVWKAHLFHSLVAGTYEVNPTLAIPEIAKILSGGEVLNNRIVITFPEGLTMAQMADLITAKGLDGSGFLALAKNPPTDLAKQYDFLAGLPPNATLEGYLFPDTYFFAKDATAQNIVEKMLANFNVKLTADMRTQIAGEQKTIRQIIIMASIIQGEVRSAADMKTVSGIFWNRIAAGVRLQSDATLEYVLGTNKLQHSTVETQTQSPYNTYQVVGLPPGPVSNPGIAAIDAAINPTQSDYFYFLTDPKTGQTIFAKTYDEHVANKAKYGL